MKVFYFDVKVVLKNGYIARYRIYTNNEKEAIERAMENEGFQDYAVIEGKGYFEKQITERNVKMKIQPSEIYSVATATLPACDIDRHGSDLYLRVTHESKLLLDRFQYRHMVKTFIDNIDHVLWYDLPFCCLAEYIAECGKEKGAVENDH